MKIDYELNQTTVSQYRELYYKHYKNLLSKHGNDNIRILMKPFLNNLGWTWKQFSDFKSIDMFQRLVFEYSHCFTKTLESKPDYRKYDPNYGALRLKDNDLSEDKDVSH